MSRNGALGNIVSPIEKFSHIGSSFPMFLLDQAGKLFSAFLEGCDLRAHTRSLHRFSSGNPLWHRLHFSHVSRWRSGEARFFSAFFENRREPIISLTQTHTVCYTDKY